MYISMYNGNIIRHIMRRIDNLNIRKSEGFNSKMYEQQ